MVQAPPSSEPSKPSLVSLTGAIEAAILECGVTDPSEQELVREAYRLHYQAIVAAERKTLEEDFREFVKWAWRLLRPAEDLQWDIGSELMCKALMALRREEFLRLVINIPPRSLKSTIVNVLYIIWVWIQDVDDVYLGGPSHEFLCISHSDGLASRDSQSARRIMQHPEFVKRWGGRVAFARGQNEKTRFGLAKGGGRIVGSVGSNVIGENAHTLILDDLNTGADIYSEALRSAVQEKYDTDISTRKNSKLRSKEVCVQQRVVGGDITDHMIKAHGLYHPEKNPLGVMHLVLPMEFELDEPGKPPVNPAGAWGFKDPRTEPGQLLRPEREPLWVIEAEIRSKSGGVLDRSGWFYTGMLQQRPSPRGGGMFKKSYWRRWEKDKPPKCIHKFASWDTAYDANKMKTNAFSVCLIWGIFHLPEDPATVYRLILLGEWHDRVDFVDLYAKMVQIQEDHDIDAHFIEKKASGLSIIETLRRMTQTTKSGKRIWIRTIRPDKSKESRAAASTGALHNGFVYYPDRKWAHFIVDEMAKYDRAPPPCKDIVDVFSQSVIYLEKGYYLGHPDDDEAPPPVAVAPPPWIKKRDREVKQVTYHGR